LAESHVVPALVNKRAEIAGMITRTEQQLGQFRADLVHLDATIQLFAPEMEPKTIPAKRIRQSDLWFEQGELSRRVLDALRRAGEPIRAPDRRPWRPLVDLRSGGLTLLLLPAMPLPISGPWAGWRMRKR
jgi:hypothetical protein